MVWRFSVQFMDLFREVLVQDLLKEVLQSVRLTGESQIVWVEVTCRATQSILCRTKHAVAAWHHVKHHGYSVCMPTWLLHVVTG